MRAPADEQMRKMEPTTSFSCFTHPSLRSAVRFATWQRTLASVLLTLLVVISGFASLGVFLLFWLVWQLGLRKRPARPLLHVGDDGIRITDEGKHAFVSWSHVSEVEEHDQGARIHLKNGRVLQAFCDVGKTAATDMLARQLSKRHAASRRLEASEQNVARIGRGRRALAQWLDELRGLDPRAGGYRTTAMTERELWEIVENPMAPADARAGAAFVLTRIGEGTRGEGGNDEPAVRLRVVAEATAAPELSRALSAASTGEIAELERAMTKV
jgi:hypothetical protein